MDIVKIAEDQLTHKLVWSPKIICQAGEPAQVNLGFEGDSLYSADVFIPKDYPHECIQVSIMMKEEGKIIFSSDSKVRL